MEEEISLLLHQYQEYHTNNASGITEESLVKQSRDFLTTVKPEDRFVHLNVDFYRNVLRIIAQKLEKNEESIQMINTGFNSLEKYAVNLWKFPWRKEYHTIKLYTAFFKCNIEQQLQVTEAIFYILKSLGYTVMGQQEVVNKEPDRELAIWASLNLFLVQVDLQLIKEIMDHFPESEFTLEYIVKVRSRTHNVEDAVNSLQRKIAKRRKIDEPQAGEASSHVHTKETHFGRIDTFQNIQPEARRSDAVASADQSTSRPPKLSVLSKRRDDVAADTEDDTSTGSVVNRTHPSAGASSEYKVPLENFRGQYLPNIDTNQLGQVTDHDLYGVSPEESHPSGAKSYNVDARYDRASQTGPPQYSHNTKGSQAYEGKQHGLDARYHSVPQAGLPQYLDNTKGSQMYGEKQHGFDVRFHTVPQVGPSHQYSNKGRIDAAITTSHSLSHPGTVTPLHSSQYSRISGFPRQGSPGHGVVTQSEEVHPSNKVITDINGYQSRSEAHMIGSAAGGHRYVNIRDINRSAHQQFGSSESDQSMSTKDSARQPDDKGTKVGQPRAEPMEVEQTGSSRESRHDVTSSSNGMTGGAYARPTGQSGVSDLNTPLKHRLRSAQDATRSRGGATTEPQPKRLQYQLESNSTSTKEAAYKTRSSVADVKNHAAEKVEVKSSSPVTKRKTLAQSDRSQNPGHSSRNDPHNEVSPERSMLEKHVKGDATTCICDLCGLRGTNICKNCFRIVCGKCEEIYVNDLCEATKGQHTFVKLKSNQTLQSKSELSSQNYGNVGDDIKGDGEDWSCSRCTFLNPADHKICAMCATTRGVDALELTQAGSRVCRECTYHNNEYAKVCIACDKTLDLVNPETSV